MAFQTINITEREDELLIKVLEKRIYLGVTDIFSEEINQALNKDVDTFVIDMGNVSVMNSSGIGVLIKARDEIMKKSKSLKLTNLQPLMKDIFDRMRLDTLFDIV
ncbi:STAS domain-containing protein [candidate division KSB1 bacterium]|nr:STAS domain-containing protein [candidate division KSB1 bacterium]